MSDPPRPPPPKSYVPLTLLEGLPAPLPPRPRQKDENSSGQELLTPSMKSDSIDELLSLVPSRPSSDNVTPSKPGPPGRPTRPPVAAEVRSPVPTEARSPPPAPSEARSPPPSETKSHVPLVKTNSSGFSKGSINRHDGKRPEITIVSAVPMGSSLFASANAPLVAPPPVAPPLQQRQSQGVIVVTKDLLVEPSESPPPPPDHDADHHGNQGDGHAPVDFTSKKAHPPVKPIPYKTLGGPQEVPRPTPTKEVILPSPDRSSPLRPPKVPEATPSASVSSATVADQSRDHLPSLIQFDDDTKAAPKKGNPPPRPSINPTATVPSSSPDVKHKGSKDLHVSDGTLSLKKLLILDEDHEVGGDLVTLALPKPLLELPSQPTVAAPVATKRAKPLPPQKPLLDTPTPAAPATLGEAPPKKLPPPLKPHPPPVQEQANLKEATHPPSEPAPDAETSGIKKPRPPPAKPAQPPQSKVAPLQSTPGTEPHLPEGPVKADVMAELELGGVVENQGENPVPAGEVPRRSPKLSKPPPRPVSMPPGKLAALEHQMVEEASKTDKQKAVESEEGAGKAVPPTTAAETKQKPKPPRPAGGVPHPALKPAKSLMDDDGSNTTLLMDLQPSQVTVAPLKGDAPLPADGKRRPAQPPKPQSLPKPLVPSVLEPLVPEPALPKPLVPESALPKPLVPEPASSKPLVLEPALPKPLVPEPASSKPLVLEPALPEPLVPEPVVAQNTEEDKKAEEPPKAAAKPPPGRPTPVRHAPARPAPSKPPAGKAPVKAAPAKPTAGPSKPPAKSTQAAKTARSDESGLPPLPARPGRGHPLYHYVCTEPHGVATCDYTSKSADCLSYNEGDLIVLVEKVDSNWYKAVNTDADDAEGMVKASHLKILKKLPGSDKVQGFEEGPCAVATHDFSGVSSDELTFKGGELIMLKSRVNSEWLRGKLLDGSEGIFPKNFVEIVEDLPPDATDAAYLAAQSTANAVKSGPHCIALHPFDADKADELTFVAGDVIELVGRVDQDWLRGRLGTREGIFPVQFVDIKIDLPPPVEASPAAAPVNLPAPTLTHPPAPTPAHPTTTAVYDFDGQEGELSFKVGARIVLLNKVDDNWLTGELNGAIGIFPVSFVDNIPNDLPLKEKGQDVGVASTVPTEKAATVLTGKCEAIYEFVAEGTGELSLKPGDIITTTEWVSEDWMRGKVGTTEGIFPVNFVKVLKELPRASAAITPAPTSGGAPSKSVSSAAPVSNTTHLSDDLMPRAVALYDYTAGSSNEISFNAGDALFLLEKVNADWFMGENVKTKQIGEFPVNFVEVQVPLP